MIKNQIYAPIEEADYMWFKTKSKIGRPKNRRRERWPDRKRKSTTLLLSLLERKPEGRLESGVRGEKGFGLEIFC